MNTVTLHFKADNQQLTALDGLYKLASNTVEYVKAIFTLGENWTGFDVVRAAWYTDFECISTVLDGNGECFVPWEVLSRPEGVTINLYGCDLEEESDGEAVLVDRLTTYPVKAILVDVDARVCGSETKPVTPSQFEQYIAIVQELVGTVRDITSCVLNPDYTLTINYSDDTSDTVGPIRGEQGEQGPTGPTGNGISKIEKISTAGLVDTYRITFTNGTHKDYTVTNGAKGDTGNGIESIYLTGTSGAVKTYTILFTNGDTFEYQVTDGEVTRAELEAVLPTDTASGAIASFPDGSNLFPLKKCEVTLEPIQDLSHGDPSPSNICPISGRSSVGVTRAGVNLWDEETRLGTYDGSTGAYNGSDYPDRLCNKNPITVEPNTEYYFKYKSGTTGGNVYYYDASGAFISMQTNRGNLAFTTPNNCRSINVSFGDVYGTTYNDDISINSPSTDHDYHAYNGHTYTIPLGTTVYGAVVDCVSGVMKIDKVITDLESGMTGGGVGQGYAFYKKVTDAKLVPNGSVANVIAEAYTAIRFNAMSVTVGSIAIRDNGYLYVNTGSSSVQPTGKAVYELATPTEIQLTPQQISILKGQNNIFSDGQINVTYKADTQLWVEKKLGQ